MRMDVIAVGSVLPWMSDATDDRGRPLDWRDAQRNRIVLFTHPATCQQCVDYAHDLLESHDELARWDGQLWLSGDSVDVGASLPDDIARITGADDRRLRQGCGLSMAAAHIVVADRWGQIWQTTATDHDHGLPDVADVVETTRFMALQCPECETLDQPVGDWTRIP